MLERFLVWLVDAIGALGYPGIVALMAIESSIIPLPSELVMAPAGYLAATGRMDAALALACGILGSLIGSYANYWVASRVGRWVFVRYGRWFLVSEKSLERSERFFERHGPIAVFIARLFPVARHLISIPAVTYVTERVDYKKKNIAEVRNSAISASSWATCPRPSRSSKRSDLLREVLGDAVIEYFIANKRMEWGIRYRTRVSRWEIRSLFDFKPGGRSSSTYGSPDPGGPSD